MSKWFIAEHRLLSHLRIRFCVQGAGVYRGSGISKRSVYPLASLCMHSAGECH